MTDITTPDMIRKSIDEKKNLAISLIVDYCNKNMERSAYFDSDNKVRTSFLIEGAFINNVIDDYPIISGDLHSQVIDDVMKILKKNGWEVVCLSDDDEDYFSIHLAEK